MIKTTLTQAIKFQTDKAIKEGGLHKLCYKNYGQAFTEKNFCPACESREICEREKGRKEITRKSNGRYHN